MLYAIAAICVTLVILALVGKPIRIEVIHTYTQPPLPAQEEPEELGAAAKLKEQQAKTDVLQYLNQIFHNVGEEPKV